MADTRTTARPRSEVVSTISLLADERDFTAMREYLSFPFHDHALYLKHIQDLLRVLAAESGHITVALFDPEDYADFCFDSGIEPDDAVSRAHYAADRVATGPRIVYTGQPLNDLIHDLVDIHVRQATYEYAMMLLDGAGDCPCCGQDLGETAVTDASSLLLRLLDAAGPGTHHVICSVPVGNEVLLAKFQTTKDSAGGTANGADEGMCFRAVLAAGLFLGISGGLILRTITADAPDRVHGWSLSHGDLHPLTEAQVFNVCCTDPHTGQLIGPEPDVEYRAGFPLAPDRC
ncbi:hypothetical protein [Streptomyces sp. NPDC055036]